MSKPGQSHLHHYEVYILVRKNNIKSLMTQLITIVEF